MQIARDAERLAGREPVRAVCLPALMPEQGQPPVEEPLQQRRALALRQRSLIGCDGSLQPRPIGHRRAHVGQYDREAGEQVAPLARVGAFQLQIDHRLCCAGAADRVQHAVGAALRADHGVDDAVDVEPRLADRGGD